MQLLADTSDTSGALAGAGAVFGFVWLLLIIYSIFVLLVPIFVYRIMRRLTQTYELLERTNSAMIFPASAAPKPGSDDGRMFKDIPPGT